MPLLPFLAYTTVGSATYNCVLVVLGHQLGSRGTSIDRYSGPVNAVVYALIGVGVVVAAARRVRHRRRDRAAAAETPPRVSRR